jgi:hypothetical protein
LAGYRNKAHRRPEITKGHLECGDVEESRIRTAGAFHGLSEMKESANDIRCGRVIILPDNGTGRD